MDWILLWYVFWCLGDSTFGGSRFWRLLLSIRSEWVELVWFIESITYTNLLMWFFFWVSVSMSGPQDIPYVYCVFYFVSPKYLCWLMLSRSGGKCNSYLWNLSSIQYHTLFVACNLGGIVQSSLESLVIQFLYVSIFFLLFSFYRDFFLCDSKSELSLNFCL